MSLSEEQFAAKVKSSLERYDRYYENFELIFSGLLSRYQAVLAGGFVLSSILNADWANDLDVYISSENASDFMLWLEKLFDVKHLGIHEASPYSYSFLRKNGISIRFQLSIFFSPVKQYG